MAAPGGGYQTLASTDMSAALTAGVAALIRGRYPWLTAAEVTEAIEDGAKAQGRHDNLRHRGRRGHGALTPPRRSPGPPPSPPPTPGRPADGTRGRPADADPPRRRA